MIDLKSIKGITQDSRAVKPGYLFAALPGTKTDGRDFIPQAIQNGAVAILGPQDTVVDGDNDNIALLTDPNPRKIFAHLVADFYEVQPRQIAAVTGTNGKTSVVSFAEQIWKACGYNASSLGTLKGSMTTPGPVELHEQLKDLADNGVSHLSIEASSHGLAQYRLDGVRVSAAGFTNLSRDHLDYHKTMDEYFRAKSRLFTEILSPDGTAVINVDVEEGRGLVELCKTAGRKVWTYGTNGEDLKLVSCEARPLGQDITLALFGKTHTLTLPLVGRFQTMNVLCALGMVLGEDGIEAEKALTALETLTGVRGRLEFVPGHPAQAAIYVDYAHTPDALENALSALRPHAEGKLICVFGCGGDRDTGKRPIMGEVATRLADTMIVTDDNPRSEDPAAIRAAIIQGAPTSQEIPGRREAIQAAVSNLQEGDVLLIAGKGHEQGQIFADHTDPFDDVTEVKTAIRNL